MLSHSLGLKSPQNPPPTATHYEDYRMGGGKRNWGNGGAAPEDRESNGILEGSSRSYDGKGRINYCKWPTRTDQDFYPLKRIEKVCS